MKFMDGVAIIKECTEISALGYIIIIVLFVATVALAIGAFKIGETLEYKTWNDIYGFAGAAFSVLFSIAGGAIILTVMPALDMFQEPNGKYEVVVSSNVDMNEFQSRYEIIDFDNGVYTVKPKENIQQQPVDTQKEIIEEATTEIDGMIYKIIPIE